MRVRHLDDHPGRSQSGEDDRGHFSDPSRQRFLGCGTKFGQKPEVCAESGSASPTSVGLAEVRRPSRCLVSLSFRSSFRKEIRMYEFEVKIRLQGRVSYVYVTAFASAHARMLVEAQYGGAVTVLQTKRLR